MIYMKIKSAVLLVESPMQLINAIEAKHRFEIEESYLLIRYDGIASNDEHIDYILNSIDNRFSNISKIMLQYGKKNPFKMLEPLMQCLKYNPDYLFLGNYFSGFAKLVKMLYPTRKTIYLDDGAQTTKLYYDNKKVNLFSYYFFKELYPERIYVHHNFEFTKSKLTEKNQTIDSNTVFFIGAALTENNLISVDNYDKLFSAVVNCYKDYRIVYLPHRFEDANKYNKYSTVDILKPNMPVELYLLQLNELPRKVVSFYSAALYTINSLFGNVLEVESIKIPLNIFTNTHYAEKIEKLYDYFSQSMIIREFNEEL